MAKMGKGKLSEKIKALEVSGALTSATTIVVPMLQMDSATVILGSSLGIPIMRDGFTTETGLLPPSVAVTTVLLSPQ